MSLAVVDWRRRVHDIYARVRAASDPGLAFDEWRAARDDLFATHPASPLPAANRTSFRGLHYGPYDPRLRFELPVDRHMPTRHLAVPTATDGVVPFDRIGVIHLPGLGDLDVWWLASYGGGIFVPVKDGLAGRLTYGGGRYLLDTVKGADLGGDLSGVTGDGTLVVDLNFAYNPSCAYDPAWTCPLAPRGNTLAVDLPVGELVGAAGDATD